MSFTCGFYNSLNHDRKYDAIQMSKIFDGIIHDGVLMAIGERLMVEWRSEMSVVVGTGRAWFDHTWSENDSDYILDVEPSDLIYPRIDTVVLEVDEDLRDNFLKVVKGTPASNPVPPTLINTESVHQHPLADIRVNRGVTTLSASVITNRIGTSDCPFVTGVVQSMNIDELIRRWQAEWDEFSGNNTTTFDNWLGEKRVELQQMINTIESAASQNIANNQSAWENWFSTIQATLTGDVAANLANRIAALENRWTVLGKFYEYRDSIDDSNGIPLTASDGTTIQGRVVYTVLDS